MYFFYLGLQRWKGESRGMHETQLEFNARAGHIGISSDSSDASYFVAPGTDFCSTSNMTAAKFLIFNISSVYSGPAAVCKKDSLS